MCGIVGGVSERNVVSVIIEGLSRLEYRGYDSVGVAVINADGELTRERVTGRVKELAQKCANDHFKGTIGIGHTRWATHGGVSETNAHPHFSANNLAVVHNGIIENYAQLRTELQEQGYHFDSQTDTEVIVHLVHSIYKHNHNLLEAVRLATQHLHGAYAIGMISKDNPNEVVCARLGSPLVLGVGIEEMYFASDISALLPVTQKVVYLEEGDIARITRDDYQIWDKNNDLVERKVNISELSASASELGHYRHYMQKEIFEQPRAIADTMQHLGSNFNADIFGVEAPAIFSSINKVQIIACGTSYNAGSIAKYWIEEYANLECAVDIASEYRYRKIPANPNTLVISLSQSGETADTLASIKYAIELGMDKTLSICNVAESSLVRLSKLHMLTQAGPEIGVASTKAFTTQLVVLLYLAFSLAKARGLLSADAEHEIIEQIRKLPNLVVATLEIEERVKEIAKEFEYKHNALFLGRHTMAPVAAEGALKLKEISYIHAESYAAGELKHGPLALIDKDMPVIVAMPANLLADKVKSNVQEVMARQGQVYLFTDHPDELAEQCYMTVDLGLKQVPDYLAPILYTIPLQLLAYHTAIAKGTDVDKPRNLAKSVTVE
ncbi:MAG: glutamine--fructose-6-phosphate transaminase (isomerizing) [Neisseriaceae bacterium]|nr:MAG: glutamine--fructose-6-phosphate transaminase (isomerizing) [Neisseriaceae bacterium]